MNDMDPLSWLPPHTDLGAAIGEARRTSASSDRLASAMRLAGFRRDFTLTGRLDRLAAEELDRIATGTSDAPAGLTPLRIALLASHTVDHLVPSIRVAGLHRGVAAAVHVAPYGMYRQALFGADPALDAFAPQLVVLALDAHDSRPQLALDASEAEADAAVQERVTELRHLWKATRERYAARVVQQTLVPVDLPLFGAFDGLVPGSPLSVTERLNAAIRTAARADGVLLLDLAWQAARQPFADGVGEPVRWHQAKQLVSPALAPWYGELLARIAAAAVGRSHKCLVLDLDNTLWGGVIGDDGVGGIRLGQGTPVGEAFSAFQAYVQALAKRGVILAVCSKNDAAVAEAGFAHAEMTLARGDIAAFVANWNDKASNLRAIARTLDIGLDSLVFVDDNPAERDIVRRELPEVAVPELPDDVAGYAARLAAGGYFEAVSFTSDDASRGRSYALNAQRAASLSQATDIDGYLRGLDMTLDVQPVDAATLPRVTQLINKTNQFNLTTRRCTEAEVERLAGDPAVVALALRLSDKFGDNGLISVVIARPDGTVAERELLIDSWLMSCRVLGRQVEQATLGALLDAAGRLGATALVGEYRPSGRNAMVASHYERLGFSLQPAPPGAAAGATFWRLDIGAAFLPSHFIKVVTP